MYYNTKCIERLFTDVCSTLRNNYNLGVFYLDVSGCSLNAAEYDKSYFTTATVGTRSLLSSCCVVIHHNLITFNELCPVVKRESDPAAD